MHSRAVVNLFWGSGLPCPKINAQPRRCAFILGQQASAPQGGQAPRAATPPGRPGPQGPWGGGSWAHLDLLGPPGAQFVPPGASLAPQAYALGTLTPTMH